MITSSETSPERQHEEPDPPQPPPVPPKPPPASKYPDLYNHDYYHIKRSACQEQGCQCKVYNGANHGLRCVACSHFPTRHREVSESEMQLLEYGEPTSAGVPYKNYPEKDVVKFYNLEEAYYEFTNFVTGYPITLGNDIWQTSEHLFQAQKFFTTRPDVSYRILYECRTARDAFNLARAAQKHVRPDWFDINVDVMYWVLEQKFGQHEELRRMLLETGDKILIEDTDRDAFWGNGGEEGRGRNELGKALMRLRKSYMEEEAATKLMPNVGDGGAAGAGAATSVPSTQTDAPLPVAVPNSNGNEIIIQSERPVKSNRPPLPPLPDRNTSSGRPPLPQPPVTFGPSVGTPPMQVQQAYPVRQNYS